MEQAAETTGPFGRRHSVQPGVDELLAVRVGEDVGPPERVLDELEPLGGNVRRGSANSAEVVEDVVKAEAETGVSRSALRSWYRNGEIRSRLVDGPNGPQRLVQLDAVIERAAASPRIQRRAEREVSLEAQVTLLRHRVDQLELRLAALERK